MDPRRFELLTSAVQRQSTTFHAILFSTTMSLIYRGLFDIEEALIHYMLLGVALVGVSVGVITSRTFLQFWVVASV